MTERATLSAASGHTATGQLTAASAYAVLAALDPTLPRPDAQLVLLRRLAEVIRADRVQLSLPRQDESVSLSWPPSGEPAADLHRTETPLGTAGVLTLVTRRRPSRRHLRELADTANCLTVLHRREQSQDELRRQLSYTMQLAGEVLDFTRQMAGVRELERRRVAAEVVSFGQRQLSPLQAVIDHLVQDTGPTEQAAELDRLRAQLDRLVSDFRALVRGIHPQVLARHGLRAALVEVVSGYPARSRITGWVPPRVDPEVTASLYHLSATALHLLAQGPTDLEIVLEHRRLAVQAGGLQVTLQGQAPVDEREMRAALIVETDRLGRLGGWVEVSEQDGLIRVVGWVPDRLEPVAQAGMVAVNSLYHRTRALALGLIARYAEAPGSARARRLLSRLDEPVHVAVLGEPTGGRRLDRVTEIVRTRPNLKLVPGPVGGGSKARRPGSLGPAAAHGDLSIGMADAEPDIVLRPTPGTSAQGFDLVLPNGGPLCEGVAWHDLAHVLTTEVVARADLLRARTALATMISLTGLTPPPAHLAGSLELDLAELRAVGASELAGLENLRTG